MKPFSTFAKAWIRGIGVLGVYGVLAIVYEGACALANALPEGVSWFVGVPLMLVFLPPALYYAFRWIYPAPARLTSAHP